MVLFQHGKTLAGGDDHLAAGGFQLTGKNLQKGGFTRSVCADQAVTVAFRKFDVHIFEQCFFS